MSNIYAPLKKKEPACPTFNDDFLTVFVNSTLLSPRYAGDTMESLLPAVERIEGITASIWRGHCHEIGEARSWALQNFAAAKEYTYRLDFELTPSGD